MSDDEALRVKKLLQGADVLAAVIQLIVCQKGCGSGVYIGAISKKYTGRDDEKKSKCKNVMRGDMSDGSSAKLHINRCASTLPLFGFACMGVDNRVVS